MTRTISVAIVQEQVPSVMSSKQPATNSTLGRQEEKRCFVKLYGSKRKNTTGIRSVNAVLFSKYDWVFIFVCVTERKRQRLKC